MSTEKCVKIHESSLLMPNTYQQFSHFKLQLACNICTDWSAPFMYAVRVWLKNLAVVLWCGHFLSDTAWAQWEFSQWHSLSSVGIPTEIKLCHWENSHWAQAVSLRKWPHHKTTARFFNHTRTAYINGADQSVHILHAHWSSLSSGPICYYKHDFSVFSFL